VIQVRARADDEIDETAIHHFDDASADARRGHGARNRQADHRVFLGSEHLFRENTAGLRQARGVERLEPFVDQVPDFLAPLGSIKTDGLTGESAFRGWRAWMTVRHRM
jgi:hypothetical protein